VRALLALRLTRPPPASAPMHTDARSLPNGTVIQGDLCIVGAGAAGISIAREWANSRLQVVLLEGGGFDFEPEMQDLYRGDIVGQPYYPCLLYNLRAHET
jgi:hypothetical protein